MVVDSLHLKNFRNHAESAFTFGRGINALLGANGQGKTNVLEAVSYLSLTKSFFAAGDGTVLKVGEEGFEVEGRILSGTGAESRVRVGFDRRLDQKTYTVNRMRQERLADVIGMFPMVVLSPEKNAITFGGPSERRKFVDLLLSQSSKVYFEDLLEYRRVLKQRNRILSDFARSGGAPEAALVPWTTELVRYGSRIVQRRQEFLREFEAYVRDAYLQLAGGAEEPGVRYVSSCASAGGVSPEAVSGRMEEELHARRDEERRRGLSLVGPHRDEVALSLNGLAIHSYASQGQHKTLLVALKIAEFMYLKQRRDETPLLLLDDVFSELDESRSRRILEIGGELGQILLTTTEESTLRGEIAWNDDNRRYLIEQGTAREI